MATMQTVREEQRVRSRGANESECIGCAASNECLSSSEPDPLHAMIRMHSREYEERPGTRPTRDTSIGAAMPAKRKRNNSGTLLSISVDLDTNKQC